MISITVGHLKRGRCHQLLYCGVSPDTYNHWQKTGDIVINDVPQEVAYVHQHPHHFQSAISAINYCIVKHALMRISGHAVAHPSNVLLHLRLAPKPLVKHTLLIPFNRPPHEHMELENMMRHLQSISSVSVVRSILQGPSSSDINAVISVPNFAENHLLDFSSISQGQVSAEGILHLVNPNSTLNSGMRIFEPRILGAEFWGRIFWPYVFQ